MVEIPESRAFAIDYLEEFEDLERQSNVAESPCLGSPSLSTRTPDVRGVAAMGTCLKQVFAATGG